MKKLFLKVFAVMYRVYNWDQEGTQKARPFDFIDFEHDQNVFESRWARSFFSLLLIFAK